MGYEVSLMNWEEHTSSLILILWTISLFWNRVTMNRALSSIELRLSEVEDQVYKVSSRDVASPRSGNKKRSVGPKNS